jgi:glycosyltransferase involved in cell wall biosynthesis
VKPEISVIVCSHNSRADFLGRVISALEAQTLDKKRWDVVVVDNGSRQPLVAAGLKGGEVEELRLSGNMRLVRNEVTEEEASLVGARKRGMQESQGEILVFVDDDNVLAPDYLEQCARIAREWPRLGAWGGRIVLEYEDPAKKLPAEIESVLCQRELTEPVWSNIENHHASTPWGAGLCVRRAVAERYLNRLEEEPDRAGLDPVGREMRFGGDTDLVYTGLRMGFGKGVFPELSLTHLIPPRRCDPAFLERAFEAHGYSSVYHGWLDTGVAQGPRNDWKFYITESLRWFSYSPWERLRRKAWRRGMWRAVRELRGKKPRKTVAKELKG